MEFRISRNRITWVRNETFLSMHIGTCLLELVHGYNVFHTSGKTADIFSYKCHSEIRPDIGRSDPALGIPAHFQIEVRDLCSEVFIETKKP